MVELGGQRPLASSPRFKVSPTPSCPAWLYPQHLMVASSCGEKSPRITGRLSKDGSVESFAQRLHVLTLNVVLD